MTTVKVSEATGLAKTVRGRIVGIRTSDGTT